MDGSPPDPAERPLEDDPIATDGFVPGEGELLTTLIDLIETECDVDLSREAPLGESVDWDSLDHLLDDESRAVNVSSVAFSYLDLVVRISGRGEVSLYDNPDATGSTAHAAGATDETVDDETVDDGTGEGDTADDDTVDDALDE